MRITFFTETFLPMTDGVVTRLTATVSRLVQMGHEVMVFAPGKGEDYYQGARVVRLPGLPLIIYPEKQVTLPHPLLAKELDRFQPDVVHAVNPINLGAYGVYLARKKGYPLVSSYHTNVAAYVGYYGLGFLEPVAWKIILSLHNRSRLNLCTSKKVKAELSERGVERLKVWDKGIDTESFSPNYAAAGMRERLSGGLPQRTIFLYVGRLGYEKNLEQLRKALEALPESCLALVGDGPARSHLEKVFHGTNTIFTGFLYGRELASAYASADVFVLPSTTETLGLVLLEAMASGLPVIATAQGPPAELVTHGETGLLFNEQAAPSLLQAMYSLSQDAGLRQKLGRQALEAARLLDWRQPTEQLVQYYSEAIQGD